METIAERYDTATGRRTRFEPNAVLLQDRGHWAGVRIERWQSAPQELPESVLFQHGLVIHEAAVPAEVHWPGRRPARARRAFGSVGVLPAGLPYRGRGFVASTTLVMALAPEVLDTIVRPAGLRSVELVPSYGVSDPLLDASMRALEADVRAGYPLGPLYGDSIIVAMAMQLVREHAADPRVDIDMPHTADWRVQRIREYIQDRLHEPLTLRELAVVTGLDAFTFTRWFKKNMGMPPYRFVLHARVERAKSLLAGSDAGILEIAMQSGFASHSHLTTTFRKVVGLTPNQFRRLAGRC